MIAADAPAPTMSLAASLYSNRGKLAVTIVGLSDAGATITSPEIPDCGSVAILVRGGVKLPATVAWTEDKRLRLIFEEPLAGGRRQEAFLELKRRRRVRPMQIILSAA